jgi:hypothetical protein
LVTKTDEKEVFVIGLLKRYEVQVLLQAGHTQEEVASSSGISVRAVRRIGREATVEHVDDMAERTARRIGRPSKAEGFRELVAGILAEEPGLMSLEILRRATLAGYEEGARAVDLDDSRSSPRNAAGP